MTISNIDPTIKRYIVSAINTFIATFIVTLATLISTIDVTSASAVAAILTSAAVT